VATGDGKAREAGVTRRPDASGEQLTQAELDTLKDRLAQLEGSKRQEIVEAIATARGFGDLSENFEYHAAKNEQGLNEREITILRERVRNAVVVEAAASDVIGIGSQVEVEDDLGERMTVRVSSVRADGAVSPESPLGRALMGARAGDEVTVRAPRTTYVARVVSVSW
jgi:transcription elongation factor GreA